MKLFRWFKNLFAKKEVTPTAKTSNEEKPLWYSIAENEIGQKEIYGDKDNPRIVEYHMSTKLKATDDETPWCSSFVSWCLEKSGTPSTRNAWARSYLDWGIKLDKPKLGCIVVFSRGPTSGHVAFYNGETKDSIIVLGGNQQDAVTIAKYNKGNLLGYRWPNT